MIWRLGAVLLTAALVVAASDASEAKGAVASISGYVPVPVYYGGNKMLMDALVNGRKARFAIDTGASFSVFDEDRARRFGIAPVNSDSAYGEFTNVNRETHRVGYIKNLRAGAMAVIIATASLWTGSRDRGPVTSLTAAPRELTAA